MSRFPALVFVLAALGLAATDAESARGRVFVRKFLVSISGDRNSVQIAGNLPVPPGSFSPSAPLTVGLGLEILVGHWE